VTTSPRPAIAALESYVGAETTIPGFDTPIQLGSNELGFAPSPEVAAAIRATAQEGQAYSDVDQVDLRDALARCHGLDPARILCGSGSMEIMAQLAQCYLEPGRAMVMSQYGYRFPKTLVEINGADVILAPERDLTMDVDAMLAAVTPETAIVFAVNPNNPTGTLVPFSEIRRLAENLPSNVMLWLDGAYGEFVDRDDFDTGECLIDEGFNVVTLRTFSKVYGLAGLRVGWAYAPEDIVATVKRMRTLGSIPTQCLAGATAAVADQDHVAAVRRKTLDLRNRFTDQLRQFGLKPVPSEASFVLVEIPESLSMDGEAFYQAVKARGILLRRVANFDLPNHLRISIGAPDEMTTLSDVLADILG